MKIEIEIPDDYIKRNLYIFAGLEPVARKRGDYWEVKINKCNRCGECCKKITDSNGHPFAGPDGCIHLQQTAPDEHMCGLHIFRPHGCGIADGCQIGVEECTVKWQKVK